jgi:flagellar assembly protein FliH
VVKVATRLSKVIKARHCGPTPVARFDFRELEGDPEHGCAPAGDGDRAPHAAGGHPLAAVDCEAAVHRRLLEAERKALELEEAGYQKGYEQGEKAGYEFGLTSAAVIRSRLEEILGNLEQLPRQLLADYREWMITTAISIARHIVARELVLDPRRIESLIAAVLQEVEDHHGVKVFLHPADLEFLSNHVDLEKLAPHPGSPLQCKADSRLGRGGCRLESQRQVIDASLERQFALLEAALRQDGTPPDASVE